MDTILVVASIARYDFHLQRPRYDLSSIPITEVPLAVQLSAFGAVGRGFTGILILLETTLHDRRYWLIQ